MNLKIKENYSGSEKKDNYYLLYNSNSTNTINYVTENKPSKINSENPYFKKDVTINDEYFEWENSTFFPIFLCEATSITIPKVVKTQINKLPKKILKKIDKDLDVAKEKCMVVASNLTSMLFKDDEYNWTSLSSRILQEQVQKGKDNTFYYQYVIEALKYSTNNTIPIIECKRNSFGHDSYEKGNLCKQYKFSSKYQNNNLFNYTLKNKDCINNRRKHLYKKLGLALKNPIAQNLIEIYSKIETPTEENIINRGKALIKEGFKTRKGKLLTYINKRSKEFFIDFENRTFLEENLKQFKYLTSNGYMIPAIGDSKSGGRVVDSFNLMPSWIRKMCTIDKDEIVELDYSAFHPNIALSIFGGSTQFLSHQQVAQDLNKDITEIKIEHLSFFNKHPKDMIKSILFEYYSNKEPFMLDKIIQDKYQNNYKNTSKLLFKKEVEIMTKCITILNKQNIYVLYVYDALYCKKSDQSIVKEVMNKIVIEKGVYARVG